MTLKKMDDKVFNQTLLRYENRVSYLLMVLGGLLLCSGLFVDFSVLNTIGYKHLHYNLPLYLRYVGFIKPLSIITGSALLFTFLFRNRIIKLYHTCAIKTRTVLIVFLVLIFVSLGLIAYFPFKNHPYCMDEYNYLYQAEIFSQGKLFLEVSERYKPFVEQYMILKHNKLFSKYPPGFSLLLSIGVLLNYPGLINPLIAIITLFVLFCLVKSFLEPKYALLSVIFVSTIPYFIAYSASYFSQPTALLLATLLFYLVRKYEIVHNDLYLPVIGFITGYFFLTRPLDAFCAVIPSYVYLAYIMYKDKSLKKITYPIFTFALVFSLFLAYNYILVKKVSIAAYPVIEREFKIIDPRATSVLSNMIIVLRGYVARGIEYLPKLLFRFLLVPCAFFVPFLAIFGAFKFRSKWKWLLLSNYVMLVLMYNFHNGLGWPLYGARYYYSGLASMAVFAGAGSKRLIEILRNEKLIYNFIVLILCTHLVFSVTAIMAYTYRFDLHMDLKKDLVNTCPVNSIVILNQGSISPKNSNRLRTTGFVDLYDLQRNPFMNTSRLIAIKDEHFYIPRLNLSEIKSNFPNHSICYYNFDILRNK